MTRSSAPPSGIPAASSSAATASPGTPWAAYDEGPLPRVAAHSASLSKQLTIERVTKSDPKVQTLLATREDSFSDYTDEGFEQAFAEHWIIDEAAPIEASDRTLYRMHRRCAGDRGAECAREQRETHAGNPPWQKPNPGSDASNWDATPCPG